MEELTGSPQGVLLGQRQGVGGFCPSEIPGGTGGIIFMSGLADVLTLKTPHLLLWVVCCRHQFLSKGSDRCLLIITSTHHRRTSP